MSTHFFRRAPMVAMTMLAGSFLLWTPLARGASSTESGVLKYEAGDYEGAISDWKSAAEARDANALFNLGQAYRLGRGVKADQGKAAQYYEKAAQLGHLSATGNLGTIYYFSEPPLRNRAKAVTYWTQAAERGDARSQYMLAVLHFNGDAVSRDRARAYAYASLSAAAGLPQGRETLEQISRFATPQEIAAGQVLAETLVREKPVAVAAISPAELPKASLTRAAVLKDQPDAAEEARAAKARAAALAAASPAAPVTPAVPDAAPVAAEAPAIPQAPTQVAALAPAPAAVVTSAAWRVQFGAYSGAAAAERAWGMLQDKSAGALASVQPVYVDVGDSGVVKLQAGAFADRASANALCVQIRAEGGSCFLVRGQ